LYVHELAAMRNVMRVVTIQRNLAADLLQIQPAEAAFTPVGCVMKEQWCGSIEPLVAAMAAQ
jgi:hypothetical protein